jgi:dihydroneopterin aldolase
LIEMRRRGLRSVALRGVEVHVTFDHLYLVAKRERPHEVTPREERLLIDVELWYPWQPPEHPALRFQDVVSHTHLHRHLENLRGTRVTALPEDLVDGICAVAFEDDRVLAVHCELRRPDLAPAAGVAVGVTRLRDA